MQTATQPRVRNVRTAIDERFRGKRSPFRRYSDEDTKAVRVPEVKEDATLKALKAAWSRYEGGTQLQPGHDERMENLIGKIEYTAEDIEKFSIALAEFQDEPAFEVKAGVFLSALINNCDDTEFVVHTEHLSHSPNALGFRNTKNITVIGDVGGSLGNSMQGGTIRVKGNAASGVGWEMISGEIVVEGNADDNIGWCMLGGKIVINGNARSNVGYGMQSGEIHIGGDFWNLGNVYGEGRIKGGKIFHKGKRIWPKQGET